jgi:predicted  nucleic acid-binding Zn-ribbon protein
MIVKKEAECNVCGMIFTAEICLSGDGKATVENGCPVCGMIDFNAKFEVSASFQWKGTFGSNS